MSELPKGWAKTTLGELLFFNYGKSLAAHSRKEGPVDVYGSNGIVGSHDEALTRGPAIIVGRKGSFGEVHISREPCFPIDTTYYVDEFPATEPRYAYSLLRFLPLKEMNRASAIPGLNREDAHALEVSLPPIPEQRRIVRKLDTLNARTTTARTHLTAIAKLVEKYKAGVLEAAFANSGPNATIGELINGIKAGKNLKCDERPPRDGEQGTVKVSAVSWGEFRADQSKTFPPHFEPDPETLIRSGDFLFSRANTIELVGAVVIVSDAPGNLFLSDKVLRLDMADHIKPWLLWFLRSPQGRKQLEEVSSGNQMSMRNIGQAKLKPLFLPFPDEAERESTLSRIETAFAKIDRLAAEAEKALKLTDRLDGRILAKAFAGELVPQDPTDEPATEVLARIRKARATTPKPKRGRRKKVAT